MDRDALVIRNRSMAEAFHATPFKYLARRFLLRLAARLPISPCKPPSTERILLIRPDHLGDMLLTTPAILALRAAVPDAELHALVGPWSAEVLANYPEIDTVLTLPFPGFTRNPKPGLRSPYELAYRSAKQLRKIGYSSAVIFRRDHWWGALAAFLAGIPLRIGYDHPDVAPFLTQPLAHERSHAVVQNLRLVEIWTGPIPAEHIQYEYTVHGIERAYVNGYLEEWGIYERDTIICIHPGSGTWVKRWDESSWAVVADTLAEQMNARIVFTGGDHEMSIIRAITGQMSAPACIMAGDTHINQMAALYARAKLVLGSDSGPLHLAAAVDTPTVTLYGPADPAEFGTWGLQERHATLTSDIGCRPCRVLDWHGDSPENHPCVRDISIARVLAAARRVI